MQQRPHRRSCTQPPMRAIDDDVIVAERRHGTRSIHQHAQLRVRRVDSINVGGRRRALRGSAAGGRGWTQLRCAACGQRQRERRRATDFPHHPRSALLLDYCGAVCTRSLPMPTRSTPTRYGAVAQLFHWVIVALIVTQFVLALTADDLPLGVHKLALLARHKSFGMTILMLASAAAAVETCTSAAGIARGHAPPRADRRARHARRVLCAPVRDAAHRLDDVLRQELLGQLVRSIYLAQSHRQE